MTSASSPVILSNVLIEGQLTWLDFAWIAVLEFGVEPFDRCLSLPPCRPLHSPSTEYMKTSENIYLSTLVIQVNYNLIVF